jgi:hypothetical protein
MSPSFTTFAPILIAIDVSKLVAVNSSLFLFVFSKTFAKTGSWTRELVKRLQTDSALEKFS